MFNFIPNIGSVIAAVPAVIITLVQLGSSSTFFVVLLYIPLIIMAKIAFDINENTRWISVLLGTGENLNKK